MARLGGTVSSIFRSPKKAFLRESLLFLVGKVAPKWFTFIGLGKLHSLQGFSEKGKIGDPIPQSVSLLKKKTIGDPIPQSFSCESWGPLQVDGHWQVPKPAPKAKEEKSKA